MKPPGELPVVDPDFRFVERRAERLHCYARGLLTHLRRIRAGKKAGGYPIATVKSAAVWLIDSYAEAGVAPAPEAARLIEEIVQSKRDASTLPVRRSSEEAYWKAIKFEAGHRPDPTGKEPSAATRYAVAKHLRLILRLESSKQKTLEGTVRGWRQLAHYQANVALLRPSAVRGKGVKT
jgi:hypothetical protein